MKKAFGYLRVSGKDQVHGDGFPRQREAITKYAKAHGIQIVQFFEEKGVSGKEFDRPAWRDLMTALLADGVKIVLIEKLDRLARDLMVQETLVGDVRKQGFELVSTYEPDLCSDDPTRKLIRQVFGAFAEYDKSMIVAKLRAARQRKKAAAGRCEGRKPFGERPGERETIERMRALQAQGLNFSAIAVALNAESRPTQSGGRWFPTTVSRTLARA